MSNNVSNYLLECCTLRPIFYTTPEARREQHGTGNKDDGREGHIAGLEKENGEEEGERGRGREEIGK